MKIDKIAFFWGTLDLLTISWYIVWRIAHGQVPFYFDIAQSYENTVAFELPLLIIIPILSVVIYLSLVISGVLLLRRKKVAAIVSYIQTPFRILTIVPPSVFFITWPMKYIFDNPRAIPAIITFIILVVLSETTKIYTVRKWVKLRTVA